MIVMVERGAEWPKLPSGQRRSLTSLLAEATYLMLSQTGAEPSVIMASHEAEYELLDHWSTRFAVENLIKGDKRGKYLRGIRLIITSDVQLAVA